MTGRSTRTCQATRMWSGSAPICYRMLWFSSTKCQVMLHDLFLHSTAVDCGALPNPANGNVSHTAGATYYLTVTYTCNTGYNLTGNGIRTCQATRTWSASAPTCPRMLWSCTYYQVTLHDEVFLSTAVGCGSQPNPNRQVRQAAGTTYGQTATYSCNTGYNLTGNSTRTCQANRRWSGSAPTCSRMLWLSGMSQPSTNLTWCIPPFNSCGLWLST